MEITAVGIDLAKYVHDQIIAYSNRSAVPLAEAEASRPC